MNLGDILDIANQELNEKIITSLKGSDMFPWSTNLIQLEFKMFTTMNSLKNWMIT